jgi:hypothetical protein
VLGLELLNPVEEAGVHAVPTVGERAQHQLAHQRGLVDGELEGDRRAHAVPKEVGAFDAEVPQEGDGVVGPVLDAQGPVDVGGVPVRLLLDRDDLPGLGQGRRIRAKSTSMVDRLPWSRTSGRPVPWTS